MSRSTLPGVETVYVAGPMSGVPQFGVPAFISAADDLRARGYRVILPADLANPKLRRKLLASATGDDNATGRSWGDWLSLDVSLVADDVDAVVVLPGWRRSRGSRLETFTAFLCDKPVLYYPTLHRVPNNALFSAWTGRDMRKRWAVVRPVDGEGD